MPTDDAGLMKAAELLLLTGEYTPGYDKSTLHIAMQDLLDDDPWMREPWTEAELKAIAEGQAALGVVW